MIVIPNIKKGDWLVDKSRPANLKVKQRSPYMKAAVAKWEGARRARS